MGGYFLGKRRGEGTERKEEGIKGEGRNRGVSFVSYAKSF